MLEGRGRNGEIETPVADLLGQPAPAASYDHVDGKNTAFIHAQYIIKPSREALREGRVRPPLLLDAALDLADSQHAQKQIGRARLAEPPKEISIASRRRLAQLGENHRVQ